MSRRPDYRFAAMDKVTDEKNNIGGAWVNQDGSIRVVIDPFIVLTSSKALVLTLFPNKQETTP